MKFETCENFTSEFTTLLQSLSFVLSTGYQVTWHSGGIYSYISYVTLIRDLNIGIYISTNGPGNSSSSVTYNEVFYYIADLLLGEEPWLTTANACQFPRPWNNATSQASNNSVIVPGTIENPQFYEGDYNNKLFGDIKISRNGSGELVVDYGRLTGMLRKTSGSGVLMMEVFGPMRFLTRRGDDTIYINMTFTDPDRRGRYQELHVSAPDLGDTDILLYERNSKYWEE